MVEHLRLDSREHVSAEIDLIQSYELDFRQDAEISLGVKAVGLSNSLATMTSAERVYDSNQATGKGGTGNMVSNPEGNHNAELFKQAYDTVIKAIEKVSEAENTEQSSELDNVLNSIDGLSATPYISSVPEFVDLVRAARSNIVEATFYITRSNGSGETSLAVANALNQAKQQLAGTTVAYRPQS